MCVCVCVGDPPGLDCTRLAGWLTWLIVGVGYILLTGIYARLKHVFHLQCARARESMCACQRVCEKDRDR